MVDSEIGTLDALVSVLSDLRGASDALCLSASLDDSDLNKMLSHVLDDDVDLLQEVFDWMKLDKA